VIRARQLRAMTPVLEAVLSKVSSTPVESEQSGKTAVAIDGAANAL
jgi:hypothetical protein